MATLIIVRAARVGGYNAAIDDLMPKLQSELDSFRERLKTDTSMRVESKPGYKGGGSLDWSVLALACLFSVIGYITRQGRCGRHRHMGRLEHPAF